MTDELVDLVGVPVAETAPSGLTATGDPYAALPDCPLAVVWFGGVAYAVLPFGGPLRWTHDDGVNWIIRATPTETPTFGRLDKLSGYRVPVDISLRADDPFWYDPAMASVAVGMFEGGWSLPLTFPFELGYATGVATAQNTGDVATPCTITITGPVDYPVIHNQTTGDVWGSSITLLPGEQLIVTSAFNDKTITKLNPVTGHRQNAFGTLRTQSRWIELVPGPNRIGFTHSGEASRAQVQISWYNRFLGA